MSRQKSSTRRKKSPTVARRSRARKAPAPPAPKESTALAAVVPEALTPAVVDSPPVELDLPLSSPERVFAERIVPPEPERPLPAGRRAIFFDVENTSRAQHIAHVIDHLQVDQRGYRTEFFAVGNWRVIGHDTGRLLAGHGAHLVHSAPSVGVRDWSDLRIAVAAGVWLAAAHPGDLIEIVSDDRAFDAVGDVAASLGIPFRRLSYRGLVSAPAEELPPPAPERRLEDRRTPVRDGRGRRYRGGHRGRRGGDGPRPAPAPAASFRAEAPQPTPVVDGGEPVGEPHTAPHDEIVTVVRDLMRAAAGRAVSIDTLANTLKSRGFSRPPGSPRLITRLRRIKEIEVSRSGMITLVGAASGNGAEPLDLPASAEPLDRSASAEPLDLPAVEPADVTVLDDGDEGDDGPGPGNERVDPRPVSAEAPGNRRRRRRGGRRRHGGGGRQPSTAP